MTAAPTEDCMPAQHWIVAARTYDFILRSEGVG